MKLNSYNISKQVVFFSFLICFSLLIGCTREGDDNNKKNGLLPRITNVHVPSSIVNVDEKATFEIEVKNASSFLKKVKVEMWVDRDKLEKWDFHEVAMSKELGGNSEFTFSFSFSPEPGKYFWKADLLMFNENSGNFEVIDSFFWEEVFTVVDNEDFPLNEGKIVYHTYSSYDAWDAELFMYNFASHSKIEISRDWKIDHEMNAHFSPDGEKIVFMGDNAGLPRDWDIFIWDIGSKNDPVNLTSDNNLRDEDPKFSPDGKSIIFKQSGDVKIMDLTGNTIKELTTDGYASEESMPYFIQEGQKVVYAEGAGENSDIHVMDSDGSGDISLFAASGISEYFPIARDESTFFYTRWVSASNKNDQIYLGDLSGNSERLNINTSNSNNSDAYPVDEDHLFFSSTRGGGMGGYDLYLGTLSTGKVWSLNDFGINSDLEDLGVSFATQ